MAAVIEKGKRQVEEVSALDIVGNALPKHHPITVAEE